MSLSMPIFFPTDAYRPWPLCVCLTAAASWYLLKLTTNRTAIHQNIPTIVNEPIELSSDYDCIQSLPRFCLDEEEPPKLRPWKPKTYLTLGIQNLSFSEYLPLDRTLAHRLALRQNIVSEHKEVVLSAMPRADPAIREFYKWLIGYYLPTRYPSVYKLSHDDQTTGVVTCSVDGVNIPLEPPSDSQNMLRILAENVDAEFFFLRAQKEGDDTTYVAHAYIDCYPFGFDPRRKLGLTLSAIHAPVPGFKDKLQRSMNRYFATLPKGKIIKRHNWNLALDNNLYSPGRNPLSLLPTFALKLIKWVMEVLLRSGFPKMKIKDLDPDQVTVRCERQTLHRLKENSDTLIFTFKTYQYTLKQLKDEGLGEELAEAICGLNYSTKELEWYKGSVYWKDAVVAYLRG